MQEELLTARVLYRFLMTGFGTSSAPVPLLHKDLHVTLVKFWWCFFSAGIPEPALTRYFDTANGRSRALSNLMNRTVSHSMPSQLYRTMEENLNTDSLLHIAVWTSCAVDENINPASIHIAVSELEDRIRKSGSDTEFCELYDFFRSLRPTGVEADPSQMRKLFMHAVFRFTMLGIHAVYGDQMVTSPALRRLRACRFCDPGVLWEAVLATVPRMDETGFSFLRAAKAQKRISEEEDPGLHPDAEDGELLEMPATLARKALPPKEVRLEHQGENAGWYVVANWMDFCVNVNDTPRATYDGARELGTIPNGTLVYILSAPGYRGLHVSFGIWGKIYRMGKICWVPMNLLIHLGSPAS